MSNVQTTAAKGDFGSYLITVWTYFSTGLYGTTLGRNQKKSHFKKGSLSCNVTYNKEILHRPAEALQ